MTVLVNGIEVLSRLPLADSIPLIGLPSIWILAFCYFCARAAISGTPRTARIDKIARSPYLPRLIMEFGYWMFTLPVRLLMSLGVTPNMLTFASLAVTLGAAVLLGAGHFALGGWTLFLAFMMDAWDGIIARHTRSSSVGGEFLDATVDRYNDLIGFLGLMYYYRNDPLPLALATASLVGSTLVSYTRAKGEAVGIDPNVGWMQRHERAVYLGASTVFAPIVAAFVEGGAVHPRFHLTILTLGVMALTTNLTAVWRARFVLDGLRKKGLAPQKRRPANDNNSEVVEAITKAAS